MASFNSGKISLKGAANPVLRFWHNGVPGLDYHLRLEVMTPDNKTVELKDIDYSKLTGDRQVADRTRERRLPLRKDSLNGSGSRRLWTLATMPPTTSSY